MYIAFYQSVDYKELRTPYWSFLLDYYDAMNDIENQIMMDGFGQGIRSILIFIDTAHIFSLADASDYVRNVTNRDKLYIMEVLADWHNIKPGSEEWDEYCELCEIEDQYDF